MVRGLAVALAAVVGAAGCGGRCKEIAATRAALAARRAEPATRAPHVEVSVPLARANAVIAEVLAREPLAAAIEVPSLGQLALPISGLRAVAREVRLRPAGDGRVRFAVQLDVRDDEDDSLVRLDVETEIAPELVRSDGATRLEIGFAADDLRSVRPRLDGGAVRRLTDAIARRLPDDVARRVPRAAIALAAAELAEHLTGAAYAALRATLLARLGEVTRLRLRLPDLPIATVAIRSRAAPVEALEVAIVTDLPVRRGLAPRAGAPAASDRIEVRVATSAAAEIANWGIDRGHLPRRYTRGLAPRADGEFRPVFDWIAEDTARPLKVHVFQEEGGCSYFAVGVRPTIALEAASLEVAARDRRIERANAPFLIEVGAWLKGLVWRVVDRTRHIAASTRLQIGPHRFDTRVTGVALAASELAFELDVAAVPPGHAARAARSRAPAVRPVTMRSSGAARHFSSTSRISSAQSSSTLPAGNTARLSNRLERSESIASGSMRQLGVTSSTPAGRAASACSCRSLPEPSRPVALPPTLSRRHLRW
jgi:hypothetical protein